jgi:hypothetical protein
MWVCITAMTLGGWFFGETVAYGIFVGSFVGLMYACGSMENRIIDLESKVQVLESKTER